MVLFCFGFFFSLETVSWRNGVFSPRSPVTQIFSSRWATPRLLQRCASTASGWPLSWMTECLPFQKPYYFRGIYFGNGEYRIFKVELVTGVTSSLIIDPPPGTASLPGSLEYYQCGDAVFNVGHLSCETDLCDFLAVFNLDMSTNVTILRLTCNENSSRSGGWRLSLTSHCVNRNLIWCLMYLHTKRTYKTILTYKTIHTKLFLLIFRRQWEGDNSCGHPRSGTRPPTRSFLYWHQGK